MPPLFMVGIARKVLIVDDDVGLGKTLSIHFATKWPGSETSRVQTLKAARASMAWEPSLILLDSVLPDGKGIDLLHEIGRSMLAPVVIAMSGQATAADAFSLAASGARAFLAKPIETAELEDAIQAADVRPLAPLQSAKRFVGVASIHDVQNSVRKAMIEHALEVTGANRTATARLLNVTRQAVQQMIRDLEIDVTTIASQQ